MLDSNSRAVSGSFHKAIDEGNLTELLQILSTLTPDQQRVTSEQALMHACYVGSIEIVNHLCNIGVDPGIVNPLGNTAYRVAKKKGFVSITEILVSYGAEPIEKNIRKATLRGRSIQAATLGDTEILLERLSSLTDERDRKLQTEMALFTANWKGHTNMIRTLCDLGVDVNCRNLAAQTPLMYAVSSGIITNVEILLEFGAKMDCRDKEGRSPRDYAKTDEMKQFIDSIPTE